MAFSGSVVPLFALHGNCCNRG